MTSSSLSLYLGILRRKHELLALVLDFRVDLKIDIFCFLDKSKFDDEEYEDSES